MNIPSAAVDAAKNAGDAFGLELTTHDLEQLLNAAAPIIAARTLRDEADRLERMPDSTNTSPYVRAGQHIIQQIRNRASELDSTP